MEIRTIGGVFMVQTSESILDEIMNTGTGSPLIVRFLGPRKNRTNGNPYY